MTRPVDSSVPPKRVVHCKRFQYDVYIGRGSKWGNPFIIGRDGNRNQVCDKHITWLDQWIKHKEEIVIGPYSNKEVVESIDELKDRLLGCFCNPKRCHGDTLTSLANK